MSVKYIIPLTREAATKRRTDLADYQGARGVYSARDIYSARSAAIGSMRLARSAGR